MSEILDQLPYADTPETVSPQGEQVTVLAHRIIVWVGASSVDLVHLGADAPRVPTVLDTGNSFGSSIIEFH